MPRFVRSLLHLLYLHLAIGLAAYLNFLFTHNYDFINFYFTYAGALFLIAMPLVEIHFAARARAGFDSDEPMHLAWTFILLAAASRFAGAVGTQWLTSAAIWNPLRALPGLDPTRLAALHEIGLVIGGPVAMALLSLGLARLIWVQRRFRSLARLTRWDVLLLVGISVVTVRQLFEVGFLLTVRRHHPALPQALLWFSDPLLTLLLAEIIVIRRSVLRMGNGLIARCWGAAIIGVSLTSAANAFAWLNREGLLPGVVQPLAWYIWFAAATAFALAPCFQVAAFLQASEGFEPQYPPLTSDAVSPAIS